MIRRLLRKKSRRGQSPSSSNQEIYVHPDSYLGKNTSIGFGTKINGPALIASRKNAPVKIGKYCAIGYDVKIRPRNHATSYVNLQDAFQSKYNLPDLDSVKGPIIIGNNVWIGDNVLILSGVVVGDGAVLGAGSIVTKNVPPYSIAVGSPAKPIKKRFSDEIIEQLVQIKWWDWSEEKIRRNRTFFSTDFSEETNIDIHNLIVD